MLRPALSCGTAIAALLAFHLPALAQTHGDRIETVNSTASPLSGMQPSIPSSVSAEAILRSGGSNLADVLSSIPGVSGSGFAAGASRPIIRGMDASRVRVLEDGTSSSDASDIGPDHGVPIDPLSARSIEVVRGAATLRYGSQAIGGVVNAINNRIPTSLPATTSWEANTSYDSAPDTSQVSLLGDTAYGNFAFHADGFWRHADNYDTPLGTQPNSFFHGDGVSLGSSYFFGDNSRVGAAFVHYDAKYGVPSDITYIDMRQTKLLTGASLGLGSENDLFQVLNFTGSYGNYSHEEKDPDGTVNSTFKNKEFDGRAEALLGAIGPFTGSALGIEIQNRAFSALGEGANYLLPTLTQSEAGFLFTQLPLGDVTFEGSGRVEHVRIEGTPASGLFTPREFTPVSGAIGALWNVSDAVKLGLTGSSTARAPAQTELYARGPHDGPGTFETGDPNLKPERANSVEATIRLRLPEFSFDGSAYLNTFDNYIYGALTGRTCDDDGVCAFGNGADLRELNYAQSAATFRGLEGKASYDLWHTGDGILSVTALGDIVRATLAGGSNVPRIPPWRIGGGLNWTGDEFDAGFQVMRVAGQDDPGLFDTPTPGYVSVDAQIAWRPFPENRNIEFALSGHNLADEVVRNASALNKDLVVGTGRSIRFAVKYATN